MKVQEYQGRRLLSDAGIPVPRGEVIEDAREAGAAFRRIGAPRCVAKVQVLMGGRGKAGGIRAVDSPEEAQKVCASFLGKPFSTSQSQGEARIVRHVLLVEDVKMEREFYLGVAVDRSAGEPVILFSAEGGVDIEETALKRPDAVRRMHFQPGVIPPKESLFPLLGGAFADIKAATQAAETASCLAKLFVEKDLSLAEINPLALTASGRLTALDAKIVFDDNALFRRPDAKLMEGPDEYDQRETRARRFGLSYVSMTGNVGCLVNGAGLAMATMDVIQQAGGSPANFLDVGGGADVEQVKEGFKIILEDPRVEAILVNIFGGIMKCDVVADGVIRATRETGLKVPLVVRLEGTRVEEGRKALRESGLAIDTRDTIQEAAGTAVKRAAEYRKKHADPRR
ncbi:MAG: succinate--CoA ligase subunit beta [Omnitrophica bacterium RIFCSPHIGHO2_02_FULL_63_14]|nr:MAG: succinate--CoA ligase subunit beta [Omnitrophica bacterium RIFCSPHIGHO2_02_FULL_63_14]